MVAWNCIYYIWINLIFILDRLRKTSLFKINSFHILVKVKNKIGPHNKDVISVTIGYLLGDVYGSKRFVEGTRICFRQSIIHKEYLF